MHTELILKAEYLELPTEKSVTYCTDGLAVAVCSTVKQETPEVEESAVPVVECTTVKEEIKEEYMDTEDPLSVQGNYQSIISVITHARGLNNAR